MINLLPPEQKREIRAARANASIMIYIVLLVGALVFLAVAMVITYIFLQNSSAHAEEQRVNNEQRSGQYAQTEQTANVLRGEVSSAKTLFDNEIRYSLALVRLSQALPEGTALTSIDLSESTFGSPSTLSFLIRGESAALALRNSLNASPYFSGVSLGQININNDNNAYPYTIEVTVTINRSIGQ